MFVSFIMEKSNNKNINNIPFIIQEYLLFSVHTFIAVMEELLVDVCIGTNTDTIIELHISSDCLLDKLSNHILIHHGMHVGHGTGHGFLVSVSCTKNTCSIASKTVGIVSSLELFCLSHATHLLSRFLNVKIAK